MARIQTNIKRVKKDVSDTQARYVLRTRDLARKMGNAARDNVRTNISSPRFPGYAITGALARKVVASEPKKLGKGGWESIVRVQLTGKQKRYALIHEYGGKIPIRSNAQLRAMFANLAKYGQLRSGTGNRRGGSKLRYITIRAKHYFRDGIAKTRQEYTISRLKREF